MDTKQLKKLSIWFIAIGSMIGIFAGALDETTTKPPKGKKQSGKGAKKSGKGHKQ